MVDDKSINTNTKLNYELLTNWYQSYYMWHSAYLNSLSYSHLACLPTHPHPAVQLSQHQQQSQTAATVRPPPPQPTVPIRRHYKVPSLTKRLIAEAIDSICIQFIKLFIGILIINQTDLIDEGYIKIIDMIEDFLNGEVTTNINIPLEVLLIEAIYVSVSIFFEIVCLYLKGYTLGKYVLRLRILSCAEINENFVDRTIQVQPGTSINLKTILLRTCLKNLSIIVFFPSIVFLLLPAFFDYGQTSYDKAAKTIVVELVE